MMSKDIRYKLINIFKDREELPVLDIEVNYSDPILKLGLRFKYSQLNFLFNTAEVFRSCNDMFDDFDGLVGGEELNIIKINHESEFVFPAIELMSSNWIDKSKVWTGHEFRHFMFISYDNVIHVLSLDEPSFEWLK